MIQYIRDLSIELVPKSTLRNATIGGAPGWSGAVPTEAPIRLLQVDDEQYRLEVAAVREQGPGLVGVGLTAKGP